MSSNMTLARPYARAAFEMARSQNALADWSKKLAFSGAVAGDAKVVAIIGNPHVSAAELAAVFLPQADAVDSPYGNFLNLLSSNRRLALLPEIAALYEELKAEAERVLKVRVRSAAAIPEAQLQALKVALKKRFDREIELTPVIDASVIGGAIVDAGDVVIDGSVSGRLQRLENNLMH